MDGVLAAAVLGRRGVLVLREGGHLSYDVAIFLHGALSGLEDILSIYASRSMDERTPGLLRLVVIRLWTQPVQRLVA